MSSKADAIANHVADAQGKPSPEEVQTIKARSQAKVDFTKPELLKLLCYMEGELQARDVVIAVLKVCSRFLLTGSRFSPLSSHFSQKK